MIRTQALVGALALIASGFGFAQENPLTREEVVQQLPVELRLALLKEVKQLEGMLSAAELSQLSADILAVQPVTLITGELKQVPLPQALGFLVEGSKGVSVALKANDALSGLRVSAVFKGVTARQAVASLLRLHSEVLEWHDRGGAFSVRVREGGASGEPTVKPSEGESKLSLAELRKIATQGEQAAARWEGSQREDQAAYKEAVSKLERAINGLSDLLYDAKGPYVDPNDPDFLKSEYEGYEVDLQKWGQRLHDLLKAGR